MQQIEAPFLPSIRQRFCCKNVLIAVLKYERLCQQKYTVRYVQDDVSLVTSSLLSSQVSWNNNSAVNDLRVRVAVGRTSVEVTDLWTATRSRWRAVNLTVSVNTKTRRCQSSMKTDRLSACTVDRRVDHLHHTPARPILLSSLLPSIVR